MYTFYALLKDAFKDEVRMPYTDSNSFYQLFVDDFPNKINSRFAVRDTFDLNDVSDDHLTGFHYIANAEEVGYFKDEC